MIKGSIVRQPDWAILPLLADRWSPRAMSGETLSEAELMPLLEAARWAPSSNNVQPWRFLYARRDSAFWPVYFDLLLPGNRAWAERAGALVLFISRRQSEEGRNWRTHAYDTGAAWQNFALQGFSNGLVVHGIEGFDYGKAQRVLGIPASYSIEAMAVVGKPGDPALLGATHQQREHPSNRRPLAELAREGVFSF